MGTLSRRSWPLLALLLLAPGCRDDGVHGGDDDDDGAGPLASCSQVFNIELQVLDIWGNDLDGAMVMFRSGAQVIASETALTGPLLVDYPDPGTFQLDVIQAGEFIPATAELVWDGGSLPGGLTLHQPAAGTGARAVHAFELRQGPDHSCPVATVLLGLDHSWFAATGRPARDGNDLELLMDGEQAWATIHEDLVQAQDRIHHSTWYWESDFELYRPSNHAITTLSQREYNASMNVLEAQTSAHKRLLINRFYEGWDWIDILYAEGDLLDHAESPGDGFDVILQANPTEVPLTEDYEGQPADFCFRDRVLANPSYADLPLLDAPCEDKTPRDLTIPAASFHQKFWLIDDRVAYVGGMNTKGVDWDTSNHLVFESRRMQIDADTEDRQAVQAHEELPDYGPRKDYIIRIDGPCVDDVDDVFNTRWEQAIASGAAYSEYVDTFETTPYSGGEPGSLMAQVVATMPEPWAEMSILETQAKAFANAQSYIYIEDQYFRSPRFNDVLIATLLERPWVKLIVVTKPVTAYDGGAMYTYLADQMFRELVPDQYLMLQLRSFEVVAQEDWGWDTKELHLQDMDVHSKIVLVDDRYLSVGSANKNNRSILYDGELNVSVLDEAFVHDQRVRILGNLLGPELAGQLTDDVDANFQLLQDVAEANEELGQAD